MMDYIMILFVVLMVIAGISGYNSILIAVGDQKLRALYWGNFFLSPNFITNKKAVLRRAKCLVRFRQLINLTYLFLFFTTITAFAISSIPFYWLFGMLLMVISIMIGASFSHESFSSNNKARFSYELIRTVVRKVIRHCNPIDTAIFLMRLASKRDIRIREEAIKGFSQLPSAIGAPFLKLFTNDSNKTIATLSKQLYNERQLHDFRHSKGNLENFKKLIKEHNQFRKQKALDILDRKQITYKLETTSILIDQFIWANFPFQGASNSYYCEKCNCFAERTTYAEWSWIRCRKCLRANNLKAGVSKVIGQIGKGDHPVLAEKTKQISLWNSLKKQVQVADIHTLETVSYTHLTLPTICSV